MADVCLILEGSYPYITGGVSSWVHNLVRSLPQIHFSLLTIVPSSETYREYNYEVPDNVVGINEVTIHDYELSETANRGSASRAYRLLSDFYEKIGSHDYSLLPEVFRMFADPESRVISPMELFFDRRTWNILVREYRKLGIDDSFIDFFWTWRYSHLPILRLIDAKIPRASLYHAISTGYAGLAGVMARLKYGSPMILTEHGIYTNERRIEIEQARWIYERKVDRSLITATISPFRQMWITLFDHLGRMTYEYAEEIITLFGNNRAMQIAGGADPSRTRIIPNGIDLEAFPVKKSAQPRTGPFRIGFVGRVVPIKDVKTFIRACKIVYENRPDSEFRIIGPYDEDPEYFAECRSLVDMLGLEKCLKFTGRIDLRTEYPKLDVLVLTSISEGQPLVILEANYCGIPCVATDVGACSELLNGNLTEDRNLGPSGIVTPLANPEATAQSIMKILTTEGLKEKMGQAGIKRVERFYNEKDLTFAYLNLYRKYIG